MDELVKAVARAIASVEYAGANVCLDAQLADEEIRALAQAAIAAARPVIVEDAMIALKDELTACYSGEGVYVLSSLIDLQIERATAIRAIARGDG